MTTGYARPEIKRRRRLSPFWAFPIVALLVGAWLAYTTLSEKGPVITIQFKTATGLEAGKTRVKHKDIELGMVDKIEPAEDLSHVSVMIKMSKRAESHLTDKTRFWVVRPRLSLTSLSGIETLISGAYIEMDPAPGKSTHDFVGLEEPPVITASQAGREFVLTSERLGGLGRGSPIFYRGLKVGEIMDYDASDLAGDIKIHAFVYAPYDTQVFDGTRFWNASGINIKADASGFGIEMESLEAVLSGGIAFETGESAHRGDPAKALTSFTLFSDRPAARDAGYTRTSRAIVEFGGSVAGLQVGAPVEFRGIKIGKVLDFYLSFDPATNRLSIPVTIEIEFERARVASGDYSEFGSGKLAPALVARGLRAQLKSMSLITGQLMVAFDFFPNAPTATIDTSGPYPKLPTVPNELENITRSINDTLDKIAKLPLDAVVEDVRGILKSTQGIVGSPELKESVAALHRTLVGTDRMMNGEVGPILQSLKQALDAANGAVRRADATLRSMESGYGNDSTAQRELVDLLRQLRDAARSIKLLADFAEQHPEAFIRGKGAKQ
jgi:paraquat-inducible protein B